MYDKSYYRTVFVKMKPYVKLSKFCDELGIYKANLSRFLKSSAYDDVMSLDNLDSLYNNIVSSLKDLV